MEFLKNWIKNLVTVIIFISFIEMITPNNNLKKFVNLILGFVIMITILNPIISLLNGKANIEEEFYKIANTLNKEEYTFVSNNIEFTQEEQLMSLYKEKIKKDVISRIENKYNVNVLEVDIKLDNEKEVGNIEEIKVTILENYKSPKGQEAIPIIKIDIGDEQINKGSKIEEDKLDENLKVAIKEDISSIYSLNTSNIIVE